MLKAMWRMAWLTVAMVTTVLMATPRRRSVPDDLMDTQETAVLLHCTPGALYTMRSRGQGPPAYRRGKRLLWSRTEVLAWLADCRDDGRTGAEVAV